VSISHRKKWRHKEVSNYFQSHKANAGAKIRTWEIWVQSVYLSPSHITTSQGGVLREHQMALKGCVQLRGRRLTTDFIHDRAGLQRQEEFQHTGVMVKYD